jgi:hypothetical protein
LEFENWNFFLVLICYLFFEIWILVCATPSASLIK